MHTYKINEKPLFFTKSVQSQKKQERDKKWHIVQNCKRITKPQVPVHPIPASLWELELGRLLEPFDSHIQMNGFTLRGLQLVHLSSRKSLPFYPHTRQCMGLSSLLFLPGFGITRLNVLANLMDKNDILFEFYVLGFGCAWHLFLSLLPV